MKRMTWFAWAALMAPALSGGPAFPRHARVVKYRGHSPLSGRC